MRKIHVLLLMGVEAVLLCAGVAVASRNSSGTMSAINGPYVAGTVISSSVINARLADIESELTDSKSRSGKGDFSAPVRGANGTSTAPTYSFTSETTAGLYRNGAGDLRFAFNGTDALDLSSVGITVPGTLGVTGASTFTAGGTSTTDLFVDGGSANAGTISKCYRFVSSSTGEGLCSKRTATGNQFGIDFYTNSIARLQIANGGTVTAVSPLQIGSTGTAISASYRGTTSWTPGAITADTCFTTNITVTGAVAGADCVVSPPDNGVPVADLWRACGVTTNTCAIFQCNTDHSSTHVGASGTWACRVFNP